MWYKKFYISNRYIFPRLFIKRFDIEIKKRWDKILNNQKKIKKMKL